MKRIYSFLLLVFFTLSAFNVQAQEAFFEFSSLEEGMEVAREYDKLLLIYFFDEESGSVDTYNHIWSDPLVNRFVDKLAVTVIVDAASEEGEAFANRKRRGRRKAEANKPGIYFYSNQGRSLGVLRGALDGQEGIGQLLLMLGAADYASNENNNPHGRRRYMRYH